MKRITTCLVAAILLAAIPARAANQIVRYVISNGSSPATATHNVIRATIGEPVIGTASSAHNVINSGFWSAVPACVLPGDMNLDTRINGLDIQDFVNCRLGMNGTNCECADMFSGGGIGPADVALFVAALLGI